MTWRKQSRARIWRRMRTRAFKKGQGDFFAIFRPKSRSWNVCIWSGLREPVTYRYCNNWERDSSRQEERNIGWRKWNCLLWYFVCTRRAKHQRKKLIVTWNFRMKSVRYAWHKEKTSFYKNTGFQCFQQAISDATSPIIIIIFTFTWQVRIIILY